MVRAEEKRGRIGESVSGLPTRHELLLYRRVIKLVNEDFHVDDLARLPEFYRHLVGLAVEITESSGGSLFFSEMNRGGIISIAAYEKEDIAVPGRRFRAGEGVAGEAFQSGRVEVHSPDKPHPKFVTLSSGKYGALMAAPIAVPGQKPEGILCVYRRDPEPYTVVEISLLETLGKIIVSILRLVRLSHDLADSNRHLLDSLECSGALYSLSLKVGDRRSVSEILQEVVVSFSRLFGIERVAVLLKRGDHLVVEIAEGLPERLGAGKVVPLEAAGEKAESRIRTTESKILRAINTCLTERRPIFSEHTGDTLTPSRRIGDFVVFPLFSGRTLLGCVVVAHGPAASIQFDEKEIDSMKEFVSGIGLSIEQARALEINERAYRAAIRAIADSLETRDQDSKGHSARLVRYANHIAERLGFSPKDRRTLEFACLLHDVGKLVIQDQILLKPKKLTDSEMEIMKKHAEIGATMLERIEFLRDAAPIVRHHHERWDGNGYPAGLAGEEIPLGARILAVVDAFDAMNQTRPYSQGRKVEEALEELRRCAGSHFDPRVVEAFLDYPFEDLPNSSSDSSSLF
ncbi:MAG: HD domain-containing protein [Candidatus Hydrogenedentota bacterium]|nr:MAG: HD domain-containing protein [Candidatus Hydrogenedentota bacterium]